MRLLDVAVVIVTYRTGELTVRSIQSVQAERSTPGISIRVIVVDNASGDAGIVSRAIEANGWSSWVTLVTAPKNGGFAYGNNLGIERACADSVPSYVYLLNPDALVHPAQLRPSRASSRRTLPQELRAAASRTPTAATGRLPSDSPACSASSTLDWHSDPSAGCCGAGL